MTIRNRPLWLLALAGAAFIAVPGALAQDEPPAADDDFDQPLNQRPQDRHGADGTDGSSLTYTSSNDDGNKFHVKMQNGTITSVQRNDKDLPANRWRYDKKSKKFDFLDDDGNVEHSLEMDFGGLGALNELGFGQDAARSLDQARRRMEEAQREMQRALRDAQRNGDWNRAWGNGRARALTPVAPVAPVAPLEPLAAILPPKVMLGITMSDPDDENIRGVVVDSVREGLPAAKAGLQVGDLIVKFKGKKVRNGDDLRAILKNAEAGENAEMLVLRDGEQVTLNVNLEAYDDDRLGSRVWAWDSPQQSESHADAIAKVLAAIELLQENKNEPGVAKIHEKLLDALTKAHEELERPQARSFNFGAGDLLDGNGMVFAPRIRTTDPEALREQLDQLRELREELEESKEVRKEIEELRKEIEKLQRGDE